MNDQINFKSDINKYVSHEKKYISRLLNGQNESIELELSCYDDKKNVKVYLDWRIFLETVGTIGCSEKINLSTKSIHFIKILYCLISDACIIDSMCQIKSPIECYDPIRDKLIRIIILTEDKREIKFKKMSLADILVIFDCQDMKHYKIYEIYHPLFMKKIYGSKTTMQELMRDLNLQFIFEGHISQLEEDFKKLSYGEFIFDKTLYLMNITHQINWNRRMEKKIRDQYLSWRLIDHRQKAWVLDHNHHPLSNDE
jgi:hypothetical protein